MRGILKSRIRTGLYPGVMPPSVLDLVVAQTMKCGDLRVGLDLVKRSVLSAEKDARREVAREDVCAAYEVSKYVHLSATVKTLNTDEKRLLGHIAELSQDEVATGLTTGAVFRSAKERMKISYTVFFERVRKFDEMRLIDLHHRHDDGRLREIVLRYDAGRVKEVCG